MATAGQRDFDVPFPFISTTHISVTVNGDIVPQLEWINQTRVRLAVILVGGERVVIERDTPIDDQLVKFQDGAILTDQDLNIAVQQLLFKQQEITGLYDRSLRRARIRILESNGIPVTPEDVALQVAQIAAENVLLDDFRDRVADIDANAQVLIEHASTLFDQAMQLNAQGPLISGLTASTTTLRTELDGLTELVDALAGGDAGTGIATLIANETAARVQGDTALVDTLNLIGAKSGDGLAFIADLNKLKVSPTESFAQKFTAISTRTGAVEASVATEIQTRTTAVSAQASRIDALTTRVGNNEAGLTTEQQARVDAVSAEAAARTTLAATLRGETSAAVQAEQTARVNADGALASTMALVGAKTANGQGFILDLNKVQVSASETLSQRLTSISAASDGNQAAITAETTARTNADSAFATTIALLGAKSWNGTAFILDENKVYVNANVSLATRLSGLDTKFDQNSAGIASEALARSNADGALTQRIDTMSTTVGGNTASITSLTSTLNGVQARYGVALDVNGFVTGFVQNNNGSSGTFDVLASQFRVVMPGVTPKTVFTVDANGIAINGNVRIDGNLITGGTVTIPQLGYGAAGETSIYQNFTAINFTTSNWVTIASLSLTPAAGAPIEGLFSCLLTDTSDTSTKVWCRIIRDDGTPIWGGAGGLVIAARDEGEAFAVNFYDSVPQGRGTTWTVQMKKAVGSAHNVRVDGRFLRLREDVRARVQQISLTAPAGEGAGAGAGGGGNINGGGGGLGNHNNIP